MIEYYHQSLLFLCLRLFLYLNGLFWLTRFNHLPVVPQILSHLSKSFSLKGVDYVISAVFFLIDRVLDIEDKEGQSF